MKSTRTSRLLLGMLLVAVLTPSLTGCAVALRLLTALEIASAVDDVVDAMPEGRSTSHPLLGPGQAMITGAGEDGLRLNRSPGSHRIDVFPDGSVVTVECRTSGPLIDGALGETAVWSQVRTSDGRTGFMSDAYLDRGPGDVPPDC